MVSRDGAPVEFFLTPGATGDVSGLQDFDFDLPTGALVVADKAYHDYETDHLSLAIESHVDWYHRSAYQRKTAGIPQ